MKLWLDDVRDPKDWGHIGWVWVKTYDEAVQMLRTGQVKMASLDHDLSLAATLGYPCGEKTGYDVVCWMEEHDVWPRYGVQVHSMNPVGAERMRKVIAKHYG